MWPTIPEDVPDPPVSDPAQAAFWLQRYAIAVAKGMAPDAARRAADADLEERLRFVVRERRESSDMGSHPT